MTLPVPVGPPTVRFAVVERMLLLGYYAEFFRGRWDGPITDRPIRAAQPLSESDAVNGRVHAQTGLWFPERMWMTTEEGDAPEPFAHEKMR